MKTIQLAETVTHVLTKDRLELHELWILQSQSELQGSTVFIAKTNRWQNIDIIVSAHMHNISS